MSPQGSVNAGIDWVVAHFLNNVSYDHAAAAATRFGPMVVGQKFPAKTNIRLADCSGIVTRAAVEGGMPRYHEGIPESSGDMDRWADANPQYLLWSKNGGGKYPSLREAVAHAPRGTVFGIGGYQNGDAGHTGFLLGADGKTLESASSLGGVRYGSIWRFGTSHAITHLYLLPMNYGAQSPPPAQEDDDLTPEQNQLLHDVAAYIAERKLPTRRVSDPAHFAADKMEQDVHEFLLTENKAAILAKLKPGT